jgi:flagellar basal body-associated protein FliL
MKILVHQQNFAGQAHARRVRAMTIVELMVTMGIFTFVMLGLIYSHIFGLRYNQVVGSKLGASDQSRMAFGHLEREIRAAKSYQIGTGTLTTFTADTNGVNQIGSALKLYLTTSTNSFIQYYLDTASRELRRVETGFSGYDVTAQYLTNTSAYVTNSSIFAAEDFAGNVVTTNNYKYLIHVTLQFYQYQYPKTTVGSGSYYDYYKLEFKAAPRAP